MCDIIHTCAYIIHTVQWSHIDVCFCVQWCTLFDINGCYSTSYLLWWTMTGHVSLVSVARGAKRIIFWPFQIIHWLNYGTCEQLGIIDRCSCWCPTLLYFCRLRSREGQAGRWTEDVKSTLAVRSTSAVYSYSLFSMKIREREWAACNFFPVRNI